MEGTSQFKPIDIHVPKWAIYAVITILVLLWIYSIWLKIHKEKLAAKKKEAMFMRMREAMKSGDSGTVSYSSVGSSDPVLVERKTMNSEDLLHEILLRDSA